MDTIYIIAFFVFCMFMWNSIKIVPEHARFVLYDLGRQVSGLKGPGVIFIWPFITHPQIIKIGDPGILISHDSGEFSCMALNVQPDQSIKIGDNIRITGFQLDTILVTRDTDQSKIYTCKHCGKSNTI